MSWCWERLRADGERGNRGWDGWMVSLTQWTWIWARSRRWWRSGKPVMLQSMGSHRIPHNLTTQFSSVTQSCPTLCDPMDCSTPGFPVHHQLPELTQIHVHYIHNAIQPTISSSADPFSSRLQSFPASGLFQWVGSLHQVAKVLEFQLQSFQWIFRTDFL